MAATNRDLQQLVGAGRFQDDLFYRLHVVPIVVPPLRERAEDIPMLAAYFADKHARQCRKSIDALDEDVMAALQEYHWPGNIRELENTIERAVVLTTGTTIARCGDSRWSGEHERVRHALAEAAPERRMDQRETLRRALKVSPLKRQAARLMGISPRSLSYYLAKYPVAGV